MKKSEAVNLAIAIAGCAAAIVSIPILQKPIEAWLSALRADTPQRAIATSPVKLVKPPIEATIPMKPRAEATPAPVYLTPPSPRPRLTRGVVMNQITPITETIDGKIIIKKIQTITKNTGSEMFQWRIIKAELVTNYKIIEITKNIYNSEFRHLSPNYIQEDDLYLNENIVIEPNSSPYKISINIEYDTPEKSGIRISERTFALDFVFGADSPNEPTSNVAMIRQAER